jgi:hypothetical protein
MLIWVARPRSLCAVRPGRRAIDSAMLASGSLPMSSAEIASTIEVEVCLVSIERSIEDRMPETTTRSSSMASSSEGAVPASCANACGDDSRIADASAELSRVRLGCNIFPSRKAMLSWIRLVRPAIRFASRPDGRHAPGLRQW